MANPAHTILMALHVPQSVKDDLCDKRVYLDNRPARIVGRLNQYATVRPDYPALASEQAANGVEFAWETAKRIVEAGGHFSS